MESVPVTPTKVRHQTSSIPSPKVGSHSPREYKKRNTNIARPFSQNTVHTPSTQPVSENKSHLTSFYKENIIELNQLQDVLFQKKALLDSLTDEMNECRAKYKDVEFKWETLREERALKYQQINLKSNELAKLKEEQDARRKFMCDGHELHLQQLRAKNEADLNKIANDYRSKLEVLKFSKIQKFQNERDNLLNDVEEVRNKMLSNSDTLKGMLKELDTNKNHEKEMWLRDYQDKWKTDVETNEKIKDEIAELERETNGTLKLEASKERERLDTIKAELNKLEQELAKCEAEGAELRQHTVQKIQETRELRSCKRELEEYIESTRVELKQISEIMVKEESMRRALHNEMQELRGNIRVFCRVRPPLPNEEISSNHLRVRPFNDDAGNQTIEVARNGNSPAPHIFKFDRIFDEKETNHDVFQEIGQLVQSSLDGYNVCIFAYGQTGSGKTYTMLNPGDGIIPATISHIFNWTRNLKERGWKYDVNCQFVEIYNETIADLLRSEDKSTYSASGDDSNNNFKHEIRHNQETKETTITNVAIVPLKSKNTVDELLKRANKLRSTASTASNERSSRSHSIFIIRLSGENVLTGERSFGILNLVDLAGSERIHTSQVVGERLRETQSINKSLSCLGDVIHALGSAGSSKRHIPFRNSKLTYLLQYSLSGNSKTLMFVNVSGNPNHVNETLNSLRFASKVNSTKMVARGGNEIT